MQRDDLQGSLSTVEEVAVWVESLGEVMTLRPKPGDGSPEVAWGDLFFYYAPDGALPPGQPFATIVTKDYPDEPAAGLGATCSESTSTLDGETRTCRATIPSTTSSTPTPCTGHSVGSASCPPPASPQSR